MKSTESVNMQIQATLEAVREVGDAIEVLLGSDTLVDAETIYNVQLAVHEICTNIVVHAYADVDDGAIDLTFARTASPQRMISIETQDTGRPLATTEVARPHWEELHEGGYGLFLANTLLDEVTYERCQGTNHWRLMKRL